MKKTNTIYWIFTGLLAALMLLSAIPDIIVVPDAVTLVTSHLGYPRYFIPYIGVAKLLGVIAILVPGFPRVREWAYAGFVFDLVSAMYSSIMVGDPASGWAPIFIGLVLIATSYTYHHKRLKAQGISLSYAV